MRFASAFLLAAACLHSAVVFEPNRGQAGNHTGFAARTSSGAIRVHGDGIELQRDDGNRVSVAFLGGRDRDCGVAERLAPGVSHYALGADPSRWVWNVPHYAQVRFPDVYPGIDVVYHGERGEVEFDFLVSPEADPSRIALRFSEPVQLTASGELVSGFGRLRRPAAWQTVNGTRVPVDVSFAVSGKSGASLHVGAYDRSQPLTIDPTVVMTRFLSASGDEANTAITAGSDGAIYLAGTTGSVDFPAAMPPGAVLNRPAILLAPDAYVTRIRADGSGQDWSLFLGGTAAEAVLGLRRDALGNLYVLGTTSSPNFPVTPGAYRGSIHPSLTDLFLVKLDAATGPIQSSTFLGVPSSSALLAVDSSGSAFVAGNVVDSEFKTTPGAYQPNSGATSSTDVHTFVLRMKAAGTGLVYATFFDAVRITSIEADDSGSAVVGGRVLYSNLHPFQPVNPIPGLDQSGTDQGFVARINPAGTGMIFATELYGNNNSSWVSDVKIAADGTIHVLGFSSPINFPKVNPVPIDPPPPDSMGARAPYWVKLPPAGGSVIQSTVLHGPQFLGLDFYTSGLAPRLVVLTGGQACFLNIGTANLQQNAGGLLDRGTGSDLSNFGGTLVCVNAEGTEFAVKTFLPPGFTYSGMAAAPDGTLLLTGIQYASYKATPDAFFMRLSLDNPAPAIRAIVPGTMLLTTTVGGLSTFEVYGSGFVYGTTATVNGQPAIVRFVDTGRLVLSNINYTTIQPGTNDVVVSVPGPGGGSSRATVTGINAVPSGVTITPATVVQGAAETKLVIRAVNLEHNSTLYWNGEPRAAQFVAELSRSGHFELVLGAAELSTPFAARVAIGNPAPGGGLSSDAVFTVKATAGEEPPVVETGLNPLLFGGTTPLGPKIAIGGSGFGAATRVYWDGVEVPAEVVSSKRIDIVPPAEDLTRWGAHDVYAVNGIYRSATVRKFIGRFIHEGGYSASDPNRRRLYVVIGPSRTQYPADLAIFDLATGELLQTVTGIAQSVGAMTMSTDGAYLYLASSSPTGRITRFNTEEKRVDLQWNVDIRSVYETPVVSLLPVPGAPESVILWTPYEGIVIFDRDQRRLFSAVIAGFDINAAPAFSTPTRIYLLPASTYCWRWLEYNAAGITAGSPSCSDDPGPDVVRESGFVYLADGERAYVVTDTQETYIPRAPVSYLADLPRRRILQATNLQITEFNLDTTRQTLKADSLIASLWPYTLSAPPLPGVDGVVILVTVGWIAAVP